MAAVREKYQANESFRECASSVAGSGLSEFLPGNIWTGTIVTGITVTGTGLTEKKLQGVESIQ
jgi:hypothetical protein